MPEIYEMANIRPLNLLSEYSENITPEHWIQMAETIHREHAKYAGIILAHTVRTQCTTPHHTCPSP